MKIAFFVGQFPILSETFVIRQIAGLVRAGHDVTVIAGQWGDRSVEHEVYHKYQLEDRVYSIRGDAGGRLSRAMLVLRFALRSLVSLPGRRQLGAVVSAVTTGCPAALLDIAAQSPRGFIGRFDAVIAHFGPVGVRAMYLQQAGLLEGPIATVFHGLDMSDRATLARNMGNYRRLFSRTALMLPISRLWEGRLHAWGASPAKTRVLHMGVDLDRLVMLPADRPLVRPLRVLSVARFTEKKGLEYAIRGVSKANCEIEFDVIGSGPLEESLRVLAGQSSANTIRFLGKQPQQKVFEALERADVFLLPSVTAEDGDMEGIPVALMEAMAKGVLVLATQHSGIPELIQNGVSGLLVRERDAEGIAGALERIAAGEIDTALMRREARRAVEMQFNNVTLDRDLVEICSDLAQGQPDASPLQRDHGSLTSVKVG